MEWENYVLLYLVTLIKRMLQGFYGKISSYWFILYRVVKNSTILTPTKEIENWPYEVLHFGKQI